MCVREAVGSGSHFEVEEVCVRCNEHGMYRARAKCGRRETVGQIGGGGGSVSSATRRCGSETDCAPRSRFTEVFGTIVAPLTKLLRKDAEWEWTVAQEAVCEHVKAVLTKKPLLAYPDFRLPFRLATDASRIGLGVCLMQDQGHEWQPIAYASKANSPTEASYGITELECLAVVWAIKLFRPYFYGRPFTIITDHAVLKWLIASGNLTGKLHRWP
ncbi:hypothetical protein PI125_g23586 [Phytophthora idaei]|nr:hypothetical protein PI125_g23586 [Phytophthora idaei]